jgi:tetratricopeptide (TPR) repeat protein
MLKGVASIARKVVVLGACASVAFLISQALRQSDWYKDRLVRELFSDNADERLRAAAGLAQLKAQRQLLETIKSDHDAAREMARRALEHIWFNEAGDEAYRLTREAYQAAERDELKRALNILTGLIARHPGFAEAWNQRASVYWQMGEYAKSMADCRRVIELNPSHYGAWQGLGLCQLNEGDLVAACDSLRIALHLLPHDDATRESLRRCQELIRKYPAVTRGFRKMEII